MKHIQRILTIALALLLFSCANYSNTADQSLNEGWNLQTDTLNIDLQVNVPSVAQSDLFEAGIIPNPYLGKVEQDLQWIPQHHWDYSLTFNVEDAVFEKDNIELVFNGLDTYADVFLNGENRNKVIKLIDKAYLSAAEDGKRCFIKL